MLLRNTFSCELHDPTGLDSLLVGVLDLVGRFISDGIPKNRVRPGPTLSRSESMMLTKLVKPVNLLIGR